MKEISNHSESTLKLHAFIDGLPSECGNLTSFFQIIFKAIPDAVMFADQDRRIVMANPATETIFGYQEEELIGQSTSILYTSEEDYEEQGRIRFNLSAAEKLLPYEVKYRRKDETVFTSETVGSPIKNREGNTIGFLGLIRDISDRKKADKKLKTLEYMYRTVADFTYDWESWTRLDSTFRYVSPSCERITGYTADEFMAQPSLFRNIIIDEDKEAWDLHHHKAKQEYRLREIQYRIVRRDGQRRWIEHACRPVINDDGEILGFRSSNRDITIRKAIEEDLRQALEKIEQYKTQLEAESSYLREEIKLACNYDNIIGSSNALQYVLFKIEQIAEADTSVLILGETGTGKELIARAIHKNSLRCERPLIKINCAALPASLIESELFGHERGAFTGAHASRPGRFEIANKATIFLDEIGELPLELQAKLLRILQEGEFERVGSSRTAKVDVRVIAATNRHLEKDVKEGRFREDLWYRLNVFPITAPPLRDRLDDIPQLVSHFLEKFIRNQGKDISTIQNETIQKLQAYQWPGNIRELENVIERAVINSTGPGLQLADELKPPQGEQLPQTFKSLKDMERDYIVQVLEKTNWKVSGKDSAAEILQLDRSTLRGRMKKLGIEKP
ncbi:MAG: sigma 54-interacting transcriptional regulator [Thermodesulfobacteriota bacterium]